MRHHNKLVFVTLSAVILLAGALAAGTAAQRVVAPQTGQVWSAGEVSVPSVFSQTAEEVLFYPWSLYDAQALYPLPADDLLALMGVVDYLPYSEPAEYVWECLPVSIHEGLLLIDPGAEAETGVEEIPMDIETADSAVEPNTVTVRIVPSSYAAVSPMSDGLFGLLVGNFTLLKPLKLDAQAMLDALEWNVPPDIGEPVVSSVQAYLKDFPAQVYPRGTDQPASDALLRFASSDGGSGSMSFLICPKKARELTEEEQDRALAAVDAELRQFFLSANITDTELGVLLQSFLTYNAVYIRGTTGLRSMILDSLFADVGYGRSTDADGRWHEDVDFPPELLDEALPLDDFLAGIQAMGPLTVQLVNTQSQIVLLLTFDSGEVLGAYYDIQLGCWSGVGYMA